MIMSDKGRKLLAQFEECRKKVYLDSAGLPTIGIGHLLTKSERDSGQIVIAGESVPYVDGLTEDQINLLFEQDIAPTAQFVESKIQVMINQSQFDALVSFAFNVGCEAFQSSTLLKLLNQGNYDAVPDQLKRWVHAGGKVSPGLANRRVKEAEIWNYA